MTIECFAPAVSRSGGQENHQAWAGGYCASARARELDLEAPVMVAEINLKKLASAAGADLKYEELPKFPVARVTSPCCFS